MRLRVQARQAFRRAPVSSGGDALNCAAHARAAPGPLVTGPQRKGIKINRIDRSNVW
jgi:hypothetical protein